MYMQEMYRNLKKYKLFNALAYYVYIWDGVFRINSKESFAPSLFPVCTRQDKFTIKIGNGWI